MPNPHVPAAGTGLSNDDFDEALIRLERDLQSLRSAAATFSDRGRALIDRLKAIKTNLAVPQHESAEDADSHLLDAVDRLNELTSFVDCAWLASRSVEDRGDRDGLSMVLDHAASGLRKLSEDLHPPPSARRSAA
jgi:hypothetical protein